MIPISSSLNPDELQDCHRQITALLHPDEELLPRLNALINDNKFDHITYLYVNDTSIKALINDESRLNFWNARLSSQPNNSTYCLNIELKEHRLNTDYTTILQPPSRHPFEILAGTQCHENARDIYCAQKKLSAAIKLYEKGDLNAAINEITEFHQTYQDPEISPQIEQLTHPLSLSHENLASIKQTLLDHIEQLLDRYYQLLLQGEKLGSYLCMDELNKREISQLIHSASTHEEHDPEAGGRLLAQSILDRAGRAAKIHWSSGYLLQAESAYYIAEYYQILYTNLRANPPLSTDYVYSSSPEGGGFTAPHNAASETASLPSTRPRRYKENNREYHDDLFGIGLNVQRNHQHALTAITVARELAPHCAALIHNAHHGLGITYTSCHRDGCDSWDSYHEFFQQPLQARHCRPSNSVNFCIQAGKQIANNLLGINSTAQESQYSGTPAPAPTPHI
jgi:hypothetical protein